VASDRLSARGAGATATADAPRGIFISFEGIDGAGKSTHIQALADGFRDCGRAVVLGREPGGTPLGERLRSLVLAEAMDPLTEALLMFAARREHLLQVIEPALARGEVVLCDRFSDASFAYQGAGRGFDGAVLAQLEGWVQSVPALPDGRPRQPDMTLWFDLAPEVAAQRLAGQRIPDRFESQPVDFFRRVAGGYAQRQAGAPERFARIDASQPVDAVQRAVLAAVQARGWLA